MSSVRDGKGTDRDRIMGDPNPPPTYKHVIRPRSAPMVRTTYPAPSSNRPALNLKKKNLHDSIKMKPKPQNFN